MSSRNLFLTFFIAVSPFLMGQNQWLSKSISAEPVFETQQIFFGERFPNVVVAKDGSIIASWGRENFIVRRSEDGGKTWGPKIEISKGIHGGGLTVDEKSGDIIAFVEKEHPPSIISSFRSKDNGKTWQVNTIKILPDSNGIIPSMHMNEHGLTLKKGKHKGRLIRPSRYYATANDKKVYHKQYTNAIYSDDGGTVWQSSEPFPANGTGEATIVELSDGTLYYNSRRHFSNDGLNPRMRHIASSNDGGKTWENLYVSDVLPDGVQSGDYGLMGGLDRLPSQKNDILLFSNIESSNGRKNGMVWVSFDGGKTWPIKKSIDKGGFKYSSISVGRESTPGEGYIYLLYEIGEENNINGYGGGKIARFNLSWLLNGKDINYYLN